MTELKKYRVQFKAYAVASYIVEASDENAAIIKASTIADLSDCEAYTWKDYDDNDELTTEDVEMIK